VIRATVTEFQRWIASRMDGAVGPMAPQAAQLTAHRLTSHSKALQPDEPQNGQQLGTLSG
jgi:hypothetical protein